MDIGLSISALMERALRSAARPRTRLMLGIAAGALVLTRWSLGSPSRLGRVARGRLARKVVKPTPENLFKDHGTGTEFESRLSSLGGYLTPNDRFYIRNHDPTPSIHASRWRLSIYGTGVRRPTDLTYREIASMPQVTLTRAIECAGNGRRFFKETCEAQVQGTLWRTGAIGAAEWTGVRLRDLLAHAGLTEAARDVMPEGLDGCRARRPMPLSKALADDTLLVLRMNGEDLPPDHGFPARVLVSGWVGAANIKWVGRIQVAEEALYSPWNTEQYVLVGPDHPPRDGVPGQPITEMPVNSMLDLDWPAMISSGPVVIRGRSFAGESIVRRVEYSIDGGSWQDAKLLPPNHPGSWVLWEFAWDAMPGDHQIRVRATDQRNRCQPDSNPWNRDGYLFNAVVSHPIRVS